MHSGDLSREFDDEALPSLVQRLWSKLTPFRLKFQKANKISQAASPKTDYEPSALEKRRLKNIERNNDVLRQLGLWTSTGDAQTTRSRVKAKGLKKMRAASDSDTSDDDSSDEDSFHDICKGGAVDNSEERNRLACAASAPVFKPDISSSNESEEEEPACTTSVPIVKPETSSFPAKKKQKKLDSLSADNDSIKPFLHLVDTMHYDPDTGAKNPDAGVFQVDSVVVEHYKDGAEVVVYRRKFNEDTRTWNPVNLEDPIRVADMEQYTKNKRYVTKMNRILHKT